MKTNEEVLNEILGCIATHVTQIKVRAQAMSDKGPVGFKDSDAGVLEKYAKLLTAIRPSDDGDNDLTDEEIIQKLKELESDQDSTIQE